MVRKGTRIILEPYSSYNFGINLFVNLLDYMSIIITDIKNIKPNPKNPRLIRDEKFNKLVKSIEDFPDMLNKRPLICFTDKDGKYVILGGNMRFKALQSLNIKEIPIILADEWTEEQKAEFLIKDTVNFGEWEWDSLANEWDSLQLSEWGLEVPNFEDVDLNNFFENEVQDSDIEDQKFTITLEYSEDDYNQIIDILDKRKGSKEKIIFDLLISDSE